MNRRTGNNPPIVTPTSTNSRSGYAGGAATMGRVFSGLGAVARTKSTFGGERSTSGSNFGFRSSIFVTNSGGAGGESSARKNLGPGLSSSRPIGTHLSTAARAVNIKDPRPIADKAYQNYMVQTLVQFLIDNKCALNVTEKMLRSPQNKDFCQIFEVMYCLFEPKFKLNLEKDFRKDIPDAFRLLGYPIAISQSTMKTISATHSWPLLLAALNWLRELIIVGLAVNMETVLFSPEEDEVVSPTEPDETIRKTIFDYNVQCFSLHMQGADNFDEQDQFLKDSISRWQNDVGLEQLQNENDRLIEEFRMLENSDCEQEKISEECERLELDIEKIDKYIKEGADYNATQMAENQEKKRTIASFDQDILELRREIERKEAIISQQSISPNEVKRILNTRYELHSKIKSLDADGERLQRKQFETEKEMHKERGKIDSKMVEFKQKAKSLFSSTKAELDRAWLEYLNFDFSPYEPKFTTYFQDTLRPGIDLVIQKCNEAVHNKESDVHKLKQNIDDLEEELCALVEELDNLADEIKQTENKVQSVKQGKNGEFQREKQERDRLKNQYDELSNSKQMTCDEKEKQLESLIKERDEKANKFKIEVEQWMDYLKKTLELIMSHKEFINKLEQEKADRLDAVLERA